ncbi:MAG: hypothetical protein RL536_410 [Candidatus Parcubacteria bacterium]|jgi:hypothetical protein
MKLNNSQSFWLVMVVGIVIVVLIRFCIGNPQKEKNSQAPVVEKADNGGWGVVPEPATAEVVTQNDASNSVTVVNVETNSGPKPEKIVVHMRPLISSTPVPAEQNARDSK